MDCLMKSQKAALSAIFVGRLRHGIRPSIEPADQCNILTILILLIYRSYLRPIAIMLFNYFNGHLTIQTIRTILAGKSFKVNSDKCKQKIFSPANDLWRGL